MSSTPLHERYRAQIEALRELPLNFDIERRDDYTAANGWHIDDVQTELPPERPGPPEPSGSWEAARRVLREYRFADPSIITGIFYPDQPLEGRVMLLRGRFLWMTFYFGTRVGAVVDERIEGPDGPRQVWGFSYQTLEGHLERGQMEFTAVKWLESGRVAFRISAFSSAAEIRNPFIRLGFRLFGRRLQRRFIHNAMERMVRLVAEDLATGGARLDPADRPEVRPAGADDKAAEKIEELQEEQRGVGAGRRATAAPPRQDEYSSRKERGVRAPEMIKDAPIGGEDVARWVTFSGFWGAVFYLLACASMIASSRRQPVRLSGKTVGIGLLLHVATFVAGGSLSSAAGSLIRGKSSREQAQEAIATGRLERTVPLQALGGAAGSVVPFGLAVASLRAAERITGRPALGDLDEVRWPQAVGTMVAASGLTALAVSRIAAWVARDAKRES